MDKFLKTVVSDLGLKKNNLTIIKNSDGFFKKPDVLKELADDGIYIINGSSIEIRVHFELVFKSDEEKYFCYIIEKKEDLVEDILKEGVYNDFRILDYFPEYYHNTILNCSLSELYLLYKNKPSQNLSEHQTVEFLLKCNAEEKKDKVRIKKEIDTFIERTLQTEQEIKWDKLVEILPHIVLTAIENELWNDVQAGVEKINNLFQQYLENNYKAHILPSSYAIKPNVVTKILPFINFNYNTTDKVALLVVDGMAYWQYLLLSTHFDKNIDVFPDKIHSWIPSITQLSRQAIFRGENPISSYIQNPTNEKKLWRDFWIKNKFLDAQIKYAYSTREVLNLSNVKRLAYVDMTLDEKMHASSDYYDLYDLTQNWIEQSNIIQIINHLISEDFTVFLTTDHGNIQASALKSLSHLQTLGTNKSGSRSLRHLEYSDTSLKDKFLNENSDWKQFLGETGNTIYIKNNFTFSDKANIVTHGGSHMMEVIIPFIKLKKKQNDKN